MPNSSEVVAGQDAVMAVQYNNLRDDILDTSTGHGHTGVGEDGKQINGADAIVESSITHTQIENRTYTELVPWVAQGISLPMDSGEKYLGGMSHSMGANLYEHYNHSYLYSAWSVPENFSGTSITAKLLFSSWSDQAGDYKLACVIRWAPIGTYQYTYEVSTGRFKYSYPGDKSFAYVIAKTNTLSPINPGDIVSLFAGAYRADYDDTGHHWCWSPGYLLEYELDS